MPAPREQPCTLSGNFGIQFFSQVICPDMNVSVRSNNLIHESYAQVLMMRRGDQKFVGLPSVLARSWCFVEDPVRIWQKADAPFFDPAHAALKNPRVFHHPRCVPVLIPVSCASIRVAEVTKYDLKTSPGLAQIMPRATERILAKKK